MGAAQWGGALNALWHFTHAYVARRRGRTRLAGETAREIEATYPGYYQPILPELGNEVLPDGTRVEVWMGEATSGVRPFLEGLDLGY